MRIKKLLNRDSQRCDERHDLQVLYQTLYALNRKRPAGRLRWVFRARRGIWRLHVGQFRAHLAVMSNGGSEWEILVWELEHVLNVHGIAVTPGGACEKAALTLTELEEFRKETMTCDCTVDPREKWRQAMSLADLAEKILLVKGHPDFIQLVPHLKLLGGMTDLSQFSFTKKEDQTNNKVFELYVACMAMHILTSCSVDHPEKSDGTNPDIMGDFAGQKWAIACKAMHSRNPKTFADRIQEAVEQIEVSDAHRGIVVVNMKNTFDHDALWPAKKVGGNYHLGGLPSLQHALHFMRHEYEKFQAGIFDVFGSEAAFYQNLFKGKKAAPYVLLHFTTVCGFSGPVFTPVKTFNCLCYGKDTEVEVLIEKINMALHNKPHAQVVPGQEQPVAKWPMPT